MVGVKLSSLQGSDFMVAGAFALWLPALLGKWKKPGWWSRLSCGLSEISFSLYIIHFPIQFFLVSALLGGNLFQPSFRGLACFTVINVFCVLVSAVFWWLFESRTHQVRQWITRQMSRKKLANPKESPSI
jgi:peptidoglycan/LPS O-acetylase OafA/YrhL